jgi:hypothetical protein
MRTLGAKYHCEFTLSIFLQTMTAVGTNGTLVATLGVAVAAVAAAAATLAGNEYT